MNEYEYTPTITQLIERLESIRAAHGNVQVYLNDPDTAWTMPIGCTYLDVQAAGTMPPHVTITASYRAMFTGLLCVLKKWPKCEKSTLPKSDFPAKLPAFLSRLPLRTDAALTKLEGLRMAKHRQMQGIDGIDA